MLSFQIMSGMPQEYEFRNNFLDKNWSYWVRNEADMKRPKCIPRFCADGSYADKFDFGVGKCNILGCGCEGRKSTGLSYQQMAKIWREHGFSMKAKHQI